MESVRVLLPQPIIPKQPESQYSRVGAVPWWLPPLPGECVGRLQLLSCLARGKKRREMSPVDLFRACSPSHCFRGGLRESKELAGGSQVGGGSDPRNREGQQGATGQQDTLRQHPYVPVSLA